MWSQGLRWWRFFAGLCSTKEKVWQETWNSCPSKEVSHWNICCRHQHVDLGDEQPDNLPKQAPTRTCCRSCSWLSRSPRRSHFILLIRVLVNYLAQVDNSMHGLRASWTHPRVTQLDKSWRRSSWFYLANRTPQDVQVPSWHKANEVQPHRAVPRARVCQGSRATCQLWDCTVMRSAIHNFQEITQSQIV